MTAARSAANGFARSAANGFARSAANGFARSAALDWLKAVGIVAIVFGHTAGGLWNALAPPVYPKQLGVAMFWFVLGWGLAGERRTGGELLFRRLFVLILMGGAVSLACSAAGLATDGDLVESNYLPLLFGANLFLLGEHYPANQPLWFVGAYAQMLLLWILLRRWIVPTWRLLAAVAAVEVAVRAVLIGQGMPTSAYMAPTNWMVAVLAGAVAGRTGSAEARGIAAVAGPAVLAVVWVGLGAAVEVAPGWPFRGIGPGSDALDLLAVSAAATGLYALVPLAVCRVAARMSSGGGTPAPVRFLADGTILIFLAHMPVNAAVAALMDRAGASPGLIIPVQLAVSLIGLAVLSRVAMAGVNRTGVRDRVWLWLAGRWARASA